MGNEEAGKRTQSYPCKKSEYKRKNLNGSGRRRFQSQEDSCLFETFWFGMEEMYGGKWLQNEQLGMQENKEREFPGGGQGRGEPSGEARGTC